MLKYIVSGEIKGGYFVESADYLKRYKPLAKSLLSKNPFLGKSELVYTLLLDDILAGRLAMGETIQQDLIAQSLDYSRSPIREALTRLMDNGFCDKADNGAFKVKKVTIAEYIDFSEFRMSLEVGAIRLAARNAISDDISDMKDSVNRMEQAIEFGADARKVIALDHELHCLICRASQNQFFIQTFEANMNRMFFYQTAVLRENNYHNMISKHKKLLKAIEDRDEDYAQDCMRSHLSFYTKNMYRLQ